MGSPETNWPVWAGTRQRYTLETVWNASPGSALSNEPRIVKIEGGPFSAKCTFIRTGRLKIEGKVVPIVNPYRFRGFPAVEGLFPASEKCHVTWNFLEARGPTWILGKTEFSVLFPSFSASERYLPGKSSIWSGRVWRSGILAVFRIFSRLRNRLLCGENFPDDGRKTAN